jgi:FkbM family methyltransferase
MGNRKFTIANIKGYLNIRLTSAVWSLNKRTSKYLSKAHERNEIRKNNEWLARFNGKPFFEFTLDCGIKINLYKDSILSKEIFDGFEEQEITFMKKFLKSGDVFLDIGSNIGLFSLTASKIVQPNGKVIAFEPSPVTYTRLLENIELNQFFNIEAKNIGLSDNEGTLQMQQSQTGFDAWNTFVKSSSEKFQQTISVPVSTLDKTIEGLNKEKISLIKLDVEGWEKFVLLGALNFLSNYSPVMIVEFTETNTFSAGYFVHEIYDLLETLGYKWYTYENGRFIQDPIRLSYPYNNLIATKNPDEVIGRLTA